MARKKRVVKDKETRELEIQQAARKIFVKKGFLASTVGEIGEEACVAEGTVYRYFESKEDLYISLMIPGALEIGKGLAQIKKEVIENKIKTCHEIIARILENYYQTYLKDPDVFFIFASLLSGFFSRMSEERNSTINEEARINFLLTRKVISEGKKRGLIKGHINEHTVADILWSTFFGVAILEESKKRGTQKNHIYPTLVQAFSFLAQAICSDADGDSSLEDLLNEDR